MDTKELHVAEAGSERSSHSGNGARVLLRRWASLQVTLPLFGLLLFAIVCYYAGLVRAWWVLTVPLLLLSTNLLAAIIINPIFRSQVPLLVFHLALLALLILLAASRMSYLDGQLEIDVGGEFTGKLTAFESGPLHQWHLERTAFRLDDFDVKYAPGPSRDETHSIVLWRDAKGMQHKGVVGDHHPLVLGGYHFYTTHNKGFAPQFIWYPDNGVPQQGSIHLPAYPAHEYRQALEWTIPGTSKPIWTQLQFDEVIIAPDRPSYFHVPEDHVLVIRQGEARYELRPGESAQLDGGKLRYQQLGRWMGYRVTSDWTLSWLVAAGVIAALALGLHYYNRFMRHPWVAD